MSNDIFSFNWRSAELFGAPGAGKSYLCRKLFDRYGILSTCDDVVVRHYADLRMKPPIRLVRQFVPARLFKNIYRVEMNRAIRSFSQREDKAVSEYLRCVESVIEQSNLSASTIKNIRKSIVRTAAYLSLAEADNLKLTVDEGLLRKSLTIVARSGGNTISRGLREALRTCFHSYPWQRNAILVESSTDNALARQKSRGHVISNRAKPIEEFYAATVILIDLLQASGWTVRRFEN
jgi:hypothetical protein